MTGSVDETFSTINMKELLSWIQLLETKVSLCMQNQPLLFQEVSIFKQMKEYYDERLTELIRRIDRIGTTGSCLCPCRTPVPAPLRPSPPKDLNMSEQHEDQHQQPQPASFLTVVRPIQASEMNMNAESEEGNENEAEINNFLPEEIEIFNPSEMTNSAFAGQLEGAPHESHRAAVPELRQLIERRMERRQRIGDQTEAPPVPPAAQARWSITRVTKVCPKCGKCFRRIAHMLQHIRNVHNVSKSKFQCEFCGKSYRQWENLRTHQRKVHGQVSEVTHKTWAKATPCPEDCGLHFVGVGDLLLHMAKCPNKMGSTRTNHNHHECQRQPNGETRD